MIYERLNEIIYNRWEKDDCEDIHAEIFWYSVMNSTMRWILGMEDDKITKQAILDIASHMVNDDEVIQTAKELSDCFEEVL